MSRLTIQSFAKPFSAPGYARSAATMQADERARIALEKERLSSLRDSYEAELAAREQVQAAGTHAERPAIKQTMSDAAFRAHVIARGMTAEEFDAADAYNRATWARLKR